MATVQSGWRERRAAPSHTPPSPAPKRQDASDPQPRGERGGAGRTRRRAGAGADVTARSSGPSGAGARGAGPSPRQKIAGLRLTSEFELVLRLEAQDLLHLRHVPRRRGTSGGETPERSPEAGDVNAAPPLNSKGGAGRGSLRSARGGRGGLRGTSLGGGGRGRGHGAQRAHGTHVATHAATHERTHARSSLAGSDLFAIGRREAALPELLLAQCAGAALD